MQTKRLTAILGLFALLLVAGSVAPTAHACTVEKVLVPKSATPTGALAQYLDLNADKDRAGHRAAMLAMTDQERQQIIREFQALPKEEKQKLGNTLRHNFRVIAKAKRGSKPVSNQ